MTDVRRAREDAERRRSPGVWKVLAIVAWLVAAALFLKAVSTWGEPGGDFQGLGRMSAGYVELIVAFVAATVAVAFTVVWRGAARPRPTSPARDPSSPRDEPDDIAASR